MCPQLVNKMCSVKKSSKTLQRVLVVPVWQGALHENNHEKIEKDLMTRFCTGRGATIFQQPFSLPENAQTLAGIAFCAAGKSRNNFPAASKFAGKLCQQRISDSHSLLEFSDRRGTQWFRIGYIFVLSVSRPYWLRKPRWRNRF